MYSVYIKDTINGDEYEVPYLSCSFTDELNAGKNAQFSFDYDSVNEMLERYSKNVHFLFTGGLREIWIEKDNTKIYEGIISDYQVTQNQNGGMTMQVASIGYFNLLVKRRTNNLRVFSSTDAGLIAWTLIDESQTSDNPYSDLGITQGVIQTSVSRDRTFRFSNLKEEIIQLSNANLRNGFDFDIDNLRRFNVYYPTKGSERREIVFDKGNILAWAYKKPLIATLTNRVYVLGDGFGEDMLYETRTSPTDYRYSFGLLEDVLNEKEIKTSQTLIDKGDRYLNKNQSPQISIDISHLDGSPDILNYDVGDSVRVFITEMGLTDIVLRTQKRKVDINSDGIASVSILLR